jgi:hypothetical protein
MAETLEELFNQKPGILSKATDPFQLQNLANDIAFSEYGLSESAGGKGDALRHILASAIMSKRHGDTYSELIGNLHESAIPWIGSPAQAVEDRDMDIYNNALGRKLATEASSYPDMVKKAKQMIDNGTARMVYDRAEVVPTKPDYIDQGINAVSDKMLALKNWLSSRTK